MNQNIELSVNKILRSEKISRPPIKVEALAEFCFGLDFDWDNLNENELAGLNVAEKKIYMNQARADELNTNVGLRNFTIAHELGHWVLHRNLSIGERNQQMEREADKFATYFLMPEEFVRKAFANLPEWLPTEMKLDSMAKKFCVSKKAMKIRLSQRELKLIYVDFDDYSCYRNKEEFLELKAGQIKMF